MSPNIVQSEEALLKAQLDFAQKCFQNAHELNRMMDQKANFLLATVALITGALGVLASAAFSRVVHQDWQGYLKGSAFLELLIYLVIAFLVIFITTRICRARGEPLSGNSTAPGLLFPLILLKRYPNETQYKERLSNTSFDNLLEDYSHQIIEVSNIYKSKQTIINQATNTFQWLILLWIITMLLLAIVAILPPK